MLLLALVSARLLTATVTSDPLETATTFIRERLSLAADACPGGTQQLAFFHDLFQAKEFTQDPAFDVNGKNGVTEMDGLVFAQAMYGIVQTCDTSAAPWLLIDNADPAFEYDARFANTDATTQTGYDGSRIRVHGGAPLSPGNSIARWNFGDVPDGTYDVYATTRPGQSWYVLNDVTASNMQEIASWKNEGMGFSTVTWRDVGWARVGTFTVTDNRRIVVDMLASNSNVYYPADAVMIVRTPRACGDGTLDAFEHCDTDAQCASGYACNQCQTCVLPIPARTFKDWVPLRVPHVYNGMSRVAEYKGELWSVGMAVNSDVAHVYRNNTWQPVPFPTRNLKGNALVAHNGSLYALGGEGDAIPGAGFSYDPAKVMTHYVEYEQAFRFLCTVPAMRKSVSAVSFRGRLWIAGYYNSYDTGVSILASGEEENVCNFSHHGATGFYEKWGTLAVFNDRLWFISPGRIYATVDGTEWEEVALTPWNTPNNGNSLAWYTILAFAQGGKFWIMRANDVNQEAMTLYMSDDGRTWNMIDPSSRPFTSSSVVTPYKGGLMIGSLTNPPQPDVTCGDGTKNGFDYCDEDDLDGKTCMDMGYDVGTLTCTPPATQNACTFDTSGCDYDYSLSMHQTLAGGTVTPGTVDVPLLRFNVQASEPLRLFTLSFNVASENLSTLANVSLWSDRNSDGVMEKIADRKSTTLKSQILFGGAKSYNPGGLLDLSPAREHVLEVRADFSSAHIIQPFTLKADFPQYMVTAYTPDGQRTLEGTTWNGERCETKPCDLSIDFPPIEWKSSAPYCGDTIPHPDLNEQCDDGNDVLFDGCHQCKWLPRAGSLSWEQVAWKPNLSTDAAVFPFKEKFWAIGDSYDTGEVQSFTPGQTRWAWVREATSLPKFNVMAGTVHDDKMWVIGRDKKVHYSDDGKIWHAGIPLPSGFAAKSEVLFQSFNGKLWIMGGRTDIQPFQTFDVYSLDTRNGNAWHLEQPSPSFQTLDKEQPLYFISVPGAIHNNLLWILSSSQLFSSPDGIHWSSSGKVPNGGAGLVEHQGNLYTIGQEKRLLLTKDGHAWSWTDPVIDFEPFRKLFSLNGKLWELTSGGLYRAF